MKKYLVYSYRIFLLLFFIVTIGVGTTFYKELRRTDADEGELEIIDNLQEEGGQFYQDNGGDKKSEPEKIVNKSPEEDIKIESITSIDLPDWVKSGKVPQINPKYFDSLDGIELVNIDAHHLGGLAESSFLKSDRDDLFEAQLTFTHAPSGPLASDAPLYINPATSGNNDALFGVALAGNELFKITSLGDVTVKRDLHASTGSFSGDLNVDGTIYGNISGTISPGLTQGSVAFIDSSGNFDEDNANFYWDDTNNRLGIGTNNPSAALSIGSSSEFSVSSAGYFQATNFRTTSGLTGGSRNFFVGDSITSTNTGVDNLAIGINVFDTVNGGGSNNTVVGTDSVINLSSESWWNTSFGVENIQGTGSTSGRNLAFGIRNMRNITTANANIAVGSFVLDALTDGQWNIGIGGEWYGGPLDNTTTGDGNIAIGLNTGFYNIDGSYNLFLGHSAGNGAAAYTGADYNIALGYQAGYRLASGMDKNIFLGYQAGYNETGSNKLYIEGSNSSSPLVYGEFDNDLLRVNGRTEIVNSTDVLSGKAALIVNQLESQDLFSASSSGVTKFVIDTSGNVGIGTINPSYPLEVQISGYGSGQGTFRVTGTGQGTVIAEDTLRVEHFETSNYYDIKHDGVGYLKFLYNGTERMIVDPSGNVGIGTSNPTSKLDLVSSLADDTDLYLKIRNLSTNANQIASLDLYSAQNANANWSLRTGSSIGASSDLIFYNYGTGTYPLKISSDGSTVFNESGADADFRVESDNNANAIRVDASSDRLGLMAFPLSSADSTIFIQPHSASDVGLTIYGQSAQTSNLFNVTSNAGANGDIFSIGGSGGIVFNDAGADADFRIEGDTDANLFFVDASTNGIGIGDTGTANTKLEVTGAGGSNTVMRIKGGTSQIANFLQITDSTGALEYFSINPSSGTVFNQIGSSSVDFRVSGDTNSNLFFVDASTDRVGIGTNSPSTTLDVLGRGNITSNNSGAAALNLVGGSEGSSSNPTPILRLASNLGNVPLNIYDFGSGNALFISQNSMFFRAQDANDTPIIIRGSASGTQTGNLLTLQKDASTSVASFNANGYLGIGTTIPDRPIHVIRSDSTIYSAGIANSSELILENPSTTNNTFTSLALNTRDSNGALTVGSRIANIVTNHTDASETSALTFSTLVSGDFNERLRIHTNGNVGIGTTSPSYKFQVNTSSSSTGYLGDLPQQVFALRNTDSTNNNWTVMNFLNSSNVQVASIASQNVDNTNNYGALSFGTKGADGYQQRLKIDQNGAIVFNESGNSLSDFRVEGDTEANLLFVDASSDSVGIGTNTPTSSLLNLSTSKNAIDLKIDASGTDADIVLTRSGATEFRIVAGNATTNAQLNVFSNNDLIFKTNNTEYMRLLSGGNLGIGTTSPVHKFDLEGTYAGNALMALNETGDQAIFTASSSGSPVFTINNSGLADASTDGIATKVNAGAITDGSFTGTAINGLLGIDSSNGRLYFRYGDAWHYTAQTAGFQIPDYEAFSYDFDSKSFDVTKPLAKGDFLLPFVDEFMSDGAVHGLYARFSDVKSDLFSDVYLKLDEFESSSSLTSASHLEKVDTSDLASLIYVDDKISEIYKQIETEFISKKELAKHMSFTDKALSFISEVVFQAKATYMSSVEYISDATFRGSVTVSANTAGETEIPAFTKRFRINFKSQYEKSPTVYLDEDEEVKPELKLVTITKDYFEVEVLNPVDTSFKIKWLAFMIEDDEFDALEVIELNSDISSESASIIESIDTKNSATSSGDILQ